MAAKPWIKWTTICAVLAALITVGAALRVTMARDSRIDPNAAYLLLANSIRDNGRMVYEGEKFVPVSHLRKPPVLPYLIAAFPDSRSFLLAQAVFSALLALPIFFLGRQWHDELAGLVAASAWTFWTPAMELAGHLRPETVMYAFFLAGLLALGISPQAAKARRSVAAGIAFALAELTRTVFLPFVVMTILAHLVWARVLPQRRQAVAGVVLLALGFGLPIAAYQVANWRHGFAWVYDRKGEVMLLGVERRHAEPPFDAGEPVTLEDALPGPLPDDWPSRNEGQRERYFVGLALREAMSHPGSFLLQSEDRLASFWFGAFGCEADALIPLCPSWWLTALAVVGLFVLRKNRGRAFWWSLFLVINFSLIAVFLNPKPIYREMVTPWLLTLAAVGVVGALQWILRYKLRDIPD